MMLEFRHPMPLKTPLGEGWALYVTNSGGLANDVWCVVLDDGRLRHFTTEQLTMVDNGTLGIKAEATSEACVFCRRVRSNCTCAIGYQPYAFNPLERPKRKAK